VSGSVAYQTPQVVKTHLSTDRACAFGSSPGNVAVGHNQITPRDLEALTDDRAGGVISDETLGEAPS